VTIAVRLLVVSLALTSACDATPAAPGITNEPDATDTTLTTDAREVEATAEVDATDDRETTTPDDVLVADGTLVDAPPAPDVTIPPTTHTLTMQGWTMKPTEEATKCVLLQLQNPSPIRVDRIRTRLGRGSHHLIIYRSSATVTQPSAYPCSPFTEILMGPTVPMAITQVREETIALPPGVAHELAAYQMFRLEVHYLNYFPEDITTEVEVSFDVVPDDQPTAKADVMFYGNLDVWVPRGKTVTTPWKQLDVPTGLSVFSLTGHTHSLGTAFEVERSTSASLPGTRVYPPPDAPFDWEEAPTARFDPALAFTAPGDGFRFRCTWHNDTERDVGFGESATAEMCFFWAYYWPSQGPIVRFD